MKQFVGQQRMARIGGYRPPMRPKKERFVTASEIFFLSGQNPAE
jgi:hypothetical protein